MHAMRSVCVCHQAGVTVVMAPSMGEKAKWLQALAQQQEAKRKEQSRARSEKNKPVTTQVHTQHSNEHNELQAISAKHTVHTRHANLSQLCIQLLLSLWSVVVPRRVLSFSLCSVVQSCTV